MAKPYRNPMWLRILNNGVGAVIGAQLAFLSLFAVAVLAFVIGIVSVATR